MSTGHYDKSYPQPETKHYDMLAKLESQEWFQLARKRPYTLCTKTDCPYVAGSTTDFGESDWDDWPSIIVDRNALPVVQRERLLPGLVEHELVEAILLSHGWGYLDPEKPAHLVASAAENICNMRRGISAEEARRIYEPLIKADAREKLKIIHIALNLKPYLDPRDFDKRLLIHMQAVMNGIDESVAGDDAGKLPKDAVDYSYHIGDDKCANCVHFEVMAKRRCLRVRGEIDPEYWCRLHLDKEEAEEYER